MIRFRVANQISTLCDLCGSDESRPVLQKNGATYAQCLHCDFIFTNPRPETYADMNNEEFAEALDRYAAKSFSPRKQRAYEKLLRPLARYRSKSTLLEIGCNVGGFLHKAREMGWTVTGVDPAEACARYGRDHYDLDILPCTLDRAQFPEGTFDVVYSNAVFEHLASPSGALAEIQRVLRPGGVVYLDTVNYESFTRRRIGAGWKLLNPLGHLSLFSPATLRAFCRKARLKVLRIRTHGVRLRPNHSAPLKGLARLGEELRKLPLSALAKITLKGDSIDVLAQK